MTTTTVPAGGVTPADVSRLHLAQRGMLLLTPPAILALVFIVTGIIAFVFWRLGQVPGTEVWVESSRNNPAVIWSLPGFFGWLGVQTVALSFPLALSLGSTRRTFVGGTVGTHVLLSLYVSALLLALLGVELITDHWFVGLYVIDVNVLGAGDPWQLLVTSFLGTLLVLSVGGAMAAAWVRYGAMGPTVLAAATVVALGILVIALVPLLTEFRLWWLAAGAGVMIALAIVAQYGFLRRAPMR